MTEQIKVLFLSAPIGSGHIRAAQAVQQELTVMRPEAGTQLVNVFDFFPSVLGKTILSVYLKVLRLVPSLYGKAYAWGNQSGLALWGRRLVSRFFANRMLAFIHSYQPDVIVCTHATPAGLVADLTARGLIHVPCVAVITDFVVHRLWVYPEFKHYLVAQQDMRHYLDTFGIPLSSSSVSGIPVMPQFSAGGDKAAIRRKLSLDPKAKTVLLMGGGTGLMPLDSIVEALVSRVKMPLQLIAVTGHNQRLYNRLNRLPPAVKASVQIYGYTDNVHELMQASDLLVSKPGGVSSAEALAAGLPLIIYRPLPGVEQANTDYLTDIRAAVRTDSLDHVIREVCELLSDDYKYNEMKKQAAINGRPEAAKLIAQTLLTLAAGGEGSLHG